MTVGAQHDALIDFFFHPLPTPRITFVGNTEVFLRRVEVVKLQSLDAAIIATYLATTTFVVDRRQTHPLSPPLDGFE